MIQIESDCVSCGFPCIGPACRYNKAVRLICDKCGKAVERLFWGDTKQLCIDCVLEEFEIEEVDIEEAGFDE